MVGFPRVKSRTDGWKLVYVCCAIMRSEDGVEWLWRARWYERRRLLVRQKLSVHSLSLLRNRELIHTCGLCFTAREREFAGSVVQGPEPLNIDVKLTTRQLVEPQA